MSIGPRTEESHGDRPNNHLPYLFVNDYPIALTFDLFKALKRVGAGLHAASLPAEIYCLLDRVRSIVTGQAVRDPHALADDPILKLGSGDRIEFSLGAFRLLETAND